VLHSRVYIEETSRRLVSEHQDACTKGDEKSSAIAEHAWKEHHSIHWHNIRILDRANKIRELNVKEGLHIHLIPEEYRFNRDVGQDISCCCWISTLKNFFF